MLVHEKPSIKMGVTYTEIGANLKYCSRSLAVPMWWKWHLNIKYQIQVDRNSQNYALLSATNPIEAVDRREGPRIGELESHQDNARPAKRIEGSHYYYHLFKHLPNFLARTRKLAWREACEIEMLPKGLLFFQSWNHEIDIKMGKSYGTNGAYIVC